MKLAEEYVDELYFNRSCGQLLDEDAYFEKVFSPLDVEDAFLEGQKHPERTIIEKIFDLNSSYLDSCRATNSPPNKVNRINYIVSNL